MCELLVVLTVNVLVVGAAVEDGVDLVDGPNDHLYDRTHLVLNTHPGLVGLEQLLHCRLGGNTWLSLLAGYTLRLPLIHNGSYLEHMNVYDLTGHHLVRQ